MLRGSVLPWDALEQAASRQTPFASPDLRRGRSYASTLRRQEKREDKAGKDEPDDVDPNGVAF